MQRCEFVISPRERKQNMGQREAREGDDGNRRRPLGRETYSCMQHITIAKIKGFPSERRKGPVFHRMKGKGVPPVFWGKSGGEMRTSTRIGLSPSEMKGFFSGTGSIFFDSRWDLSPANSHFFYRVHFLPEARG